MRILPYLSLCCGVLEARFSNLTEFESSHRHDAVTYPHDISQNKCKRPHYATRKISKLYIENRYHHLTLQKEFRLLLNKGVHGNVWSAKHTTIKNVFKIINCRKNSTIDVSLWTHLCSYSIPILQWRHNERDGVSNHRCLDCLLNSLFLHRSKKTSKLRVTVLCEGKSPVTGEFPAQRPSNAENVSMWWIRHATVNCQNIYPYCDYLFFVQLYTTDTGND